MVWFTPSHRLRARHGLLGFPEDLVRLAREAAQGATADATGWKAPAIDLWLGDDGARLVASLPGVAAGDLELSVHDDRVTLSGKRTDESPPEGSRVVRRERTSGDVERTVRLPFRVDADAVVARLADGLLQVDLPRAAEDRPRRVTVRAEGTPTETTSPQNEEQDR